MDEADHRTLLDLDRLSAVQRTALLDSPVEASFDRIARLALRVFRVPTSLVSVVDERRQFLKSGFGFPEPWLSRREIPLSHSICQHVVTSGQPLFVENARRHPLFAEHPAVKDLGVAAYAGHPLASDDGHVLGTICAIDSKPRQWTPDDRLLLADLAAFVMTEIRLREHLARPTKPVAQRESAPPPLAIAAVDDDVAQHLIKTITERIRQHPSVAAQTEARQCPRCKTIRRVEQLVTGAESTWFRCTTCGHAWERED